MKLKCQAFPMGAFFCRAEDGRLFYGKRDPETHEILSFDEMNPSHKEKKPAQEPKDSRQNS